ncbi:MAG TPA: HIT family protein [Polyangia bacterium]|nr:HIT family protein [Polyangia bacterium]
MNEHEDPEHDTRAEERRLADEARGHCVFCKIIAGEIAASFVARDAETVAFLDRSPLFKGHVLVAPRAHVANFSVLAPELISPVFAAAQRVARAVETGIGADGAFVALNNKISQSVPHLHVHVIPRRRKDGLRGFFWPRQPYASDAERDDYAARIAAALAD